MAERDANKEALEQVEKATDSEPVEGEELLESEESQLLAALAPNNAVPNRVSADFCQCAEPSTHFAETSQKNPLCVT